MKPISNRVMGAAALAVLAIAGAIMNSQKAGAQGPTPVTISGPLPLSVSAAQSGAWTVGLAPNTAVNTTNLDEPGLQPYQETQFLGFAGCALETCSASVHFATVPAGKRLVIKEVSAFFMTVGTGGHMRGLTLEVDHPAYAIGSFPMSLDSSEAGPNGSSREYWRTNQQTNYYCDPGFQPTAGVAMDSAHPLEAVSGEQGPSMVTLSGYYVTLPAGR